VTSLDPRFGIGICFASGRNNFNPTSSLAYSVCGAHANYKARPGAKIFFRPWLGYSNPLRTATRFCRSTNSTFRGFRKKYRIEHKESQNLPLGWLQNSRLLSSQDLILHLIAMEDYEITLKGMFTSLGPCGP